MGIGDWLKGKRKAAATIRRPDALITVYDERGRELQIKRADWVKSVLAPALEKAWNDPRELSRHIVQALNDELVEQVAGAAERLVEIDNQSEDSLILAAVVRMNLGDLDGAEAAIQRSIATHGPSALALTNLAKIQQRRGDSTQWRATLRRALDRDPNQENGLLWWAMLAKEERGAAAYTAALQEIAVMPGAWRPQLWLAREKLEQGQRAGAVELYQQALSRAADVPDALMMVTGDLGNAGALEELVRIALPLYKPEVHGPPAGLNIVQALKQLGRTDEARGFVRRLQGMGWAPFAARLTALDAELLDASLPKREASAPEVQNVALDGPIWTRGLYEPAWLLPSRSEDDPALGLSTFANETLAGTEQQVQRADDLGRLTRALPLYLAEVLGLRFRIRARASMWVAKGRGPAVFGKQVDRQTHETAAPASRARRIVVAGSLVSTGVRLELWEVGSAQAPAVFSVPGSLNDPGPLVVAVERTLTAALKQLGLPPEPHPPTFHRPPPADLVGRYVSSLEQLFYQVLAANELIETGSLWNERGFFETYLALIEAWPDPPESARLIAISGTIAAAHYKSAIIAPYRKIVLKWVDESAPGSALRRLAPAILKALEEPARDQPSIHGGRPLGEPEYMAWLERVKAET